MAAELTFNEQNIANIFSVGETPWHREGTILTEAPTMKEAQKLAGHEFEVVKLPTFRAVNWGADFLQNKHAFVTVRTDTGAELGAVGPHYHPVQNWEAFEVLEPLLDADIARLETGGTLRGGADVWMLVRFDLTKFGPVARSVYGDELLPFATVCANHSGRAGIRIGKTDVRIVCANTLDLFDRTADQVISVAHYKGAKQRIVEAAEAIFGSIVHQSEVAATKFQALKQRILTEQEFEQAILNVIAPDPITVAGFDPTTPRAGLVIERVVEKRKELRRLWDEGKGHEGDHSAWEAWQGAIECLDHNADLFPARSRVASLLDGTIRTFKIRTFQSLMSLVA